MDYQKMIKKLEEEEERFDTTDSQRDANKWRIKWIKMLNEPKPPETPYIRLDPILESLNDPNFTCTPNRLLQR